MSTNPPIHQKEVSAGETGSFIATTLGASLTVKDLNASLAWYRDVLGFTVIRTFDRGDALFAASLRAGGVSVLLTQDDGAKGLDRPKGDGFSLLFTSEQDIDELAKGILERGGTVDSGPADIMGARAFRLHDPDGFKLNFSSPR
jgi:catechol 2,3-dioxygenase-like lactoylglutathione lyase family enzyme